LFGVASNGAKAAEQDDNFTVSFSIMCVILSHYFYLFFCVFCSQNLSHTVNTYMKTPKIQNLTSYVDEINHANQGALKNIGQKALLDLLSKLLILNPDFRWSARNALHHPFFDIDLKRIHLK
jgi:serine/threonine protein kinase